MHHNLGRVQYHQSEVELRLSGGVLHFATVSAFVLEVCSEILFHPS